MSIVRWILDGVTSNSLIVLAVSVGVGVVGWRVIEAVEKRRRR